MNLTLNDFLLPQNNFQMFWLNSDANDHIILLQKISKPIIVFIIFYSLCCSLNQG